MSPRACAQGVLPAPIPRLMLLDDGEVEQILCARIINRTGLVGALIGFADAREALSYLCAPNVPGVDAILLDINMPCMSGIEFLEAASMEAGAGFARAVIVMLTTPLAPKDKARVDNCAIVKGYCNKPLLEKHLHLLADMLAQL